MKVFFLAFHMSVVLKEWELPPQKPQMEWRIWRRNSTE